MQSIFYHPAVCICTLEVHFASRTLSKCMSHYRGMDDGVWAASLLGSVLLGPRWSLAQFPLLQQLFGKGARGLQKADHRGPGERGQTAPAPGWERHTWEDSSSSLETTHRINIAHSPSLTGELEQGKLQAELCIEQATESGLLDVIGRPLRFRAYKTLWGIHSQLADLSLEAGDYGEALTLLLEGYSMATECTFQKVSLFVYKIHHMHIQSDSIQVQNIHKNMLPLTHSQTTLLFI